MPFNARKTSPFFLLFTVWLVLLSFLLWTIPKFQLFRLINHHRSFWADVIFTVFTELGSGLVLIPVGIYFLVKKKYKTVLDLLVILLINTLLMSWLKHYYYAPRPLLCYGKKFVETANWITLYQKYSFPSGHTSFAFAIAAYFSLLYKNFRWTVAIFLSACAVGYSRVYLGEHFIRDVCFGSIFGVLITCSYYFLVEYYLSFRTKRATKNIPQFSEILKFRIFK